MDKTQHAILDDLKRRLKELKDSGKVKLDCLYWSGKISTYLNSYLNSSVTNSVDYLKMLSILVQEYDESIIKLSDSKTEIIIKVIE